MIRYLCDAGPEGGAVTAGNSGASLIAVAGAGNYMQYQAAAAAHGAFGIVSFANNNTAIARFPSDGDNNRQALSFVFRTPNQNPASGAVTFLTARTNPVAIAARFQWLSTGAVQFGDQPNNFTIIAAAGVLALNTKYRMEILLNGGSTTDGTISCRVFNMAGAQVALASVAGRNMTVNPITAFDFGNQGGIATDITMGYDDIQIEAGRATEIGAYVPGANVPPVVNAGADKTVGLNAVVPLVGTATDGDGTISSLFWSFVAYPGSLSAAPGITSNGTLSASFSASAYGLYVVRLNATDNSGATSTDDVLVFVPNTAVTVRAVADNSGGYTVSGTTSIAAALSDALASTYIESPANPSTAKTITLDLDPIVPLTSGILSLTDTSFTGSVTFTVEMIEKVSATVRKTWNAVALVGAVDLTLDSTSASAISTAGWNQLQLRFTTIAS